MNVFHGQRRPEKSHRWIVAFMSVMFVFTCVISTVAYGQGPTIIDYDILDEVWTWEGSPYLITTDVNILGILRIHPRVEVHFQGNYALIVCAGAILDAEGGALPEERIVFTSSTIIWDGISFIDANNESRIINCDINNVATAINCFQSDPRIEGNSIEAHSIAINCNRASPEIVNNDSIRVLGEGIEGLHLKTISVLNSSRPLISGNIWIECRTNYYYNNSTGIYIRESSPIIENNWIEVVSFNQSTGIYSEYANDIVINRNIVRVRSAPFSRGMWFENSSRVRIHNNVIHIYGSPVNTSVGIRITEESSISLINNIIVGNEASIGLWAERYHLDAFSGYNLYWKNLTVYRDLDAAEFEGDIVNQDPLFESDAYEPLEADYHITWSDTGNVDTKSPCIDNGFPDINWNDPDGTRSDMGKYYYDGPRPEPPHSIQHRGNSIPAAFEILTAYPNPFNHRNSVSFSINSPGLTSLLLYDMSGSLVRTIWSGNLSAGEHTINWQAERLSAGSYFIQLESGGMSRMKQVIYLP